MAAPNSNPKAGQAARIIVVMIVNGDHGAPRSGGFSRFADGLRPVAFAWPPFFPPLPGFGVASIRRSTASRLASLSLVDAVMSDPPPPGQAATDEAMKAVGEGIQAFGLVEWQMTCIYARLMAPASFRLCALTLEGARHFEAKKRIVQLVAEQRLPCDRLKTFNNLMNRAGRKADLRHKLAHWVVGEWVDLKRAKRGGGVVVKSVLQPPMHSSRSLPVHRGDEAPVFAGQMREFAEGCRALSAEMQRFADLLRAEGRYK